MSHCPPSRLSASPLWQDQRAMYKAFGPASWTQKGVPFQITSNPQLAKQYAAVALEHLQEGPLTFLEVGAGSGKFAYLFLQEILPQATRPVHYILTDLSEKNVAFWRAHPLLKPYFTSGVLEARVYDPVCTPFERKGPLFVIANYFFDSIEHDLFRVEEGRLFEGRLVGEQVDSYHEVQADGYYPDLPELNELLREYQTTLPKATFLIPVGAIRALQNLMPCHALVGDKGFSTLEDIATWADPGLVRHTTMSFPVNFHALREFLHKTGSRMVSSHPAEPVFSVHGVNLRFTPAFANTPTPNDPTEDALRQLEQGFFPLCQEEALLGHNVAFLWEKQGRPDCAEAWRQKLLDFQALPRQHSFIPAEGDVLQIGEMLGIGEIIRANALKSYTALSALPADFDGVFDEIFFLCARKGKRKKSASLLVKEGEALVRQIEERLALQNIAYTDEHLETFFQLHDRSSVIDSKHYLHFFGELARKKQITPEQLRCSAQRLVRDGAITQAEAENFALEEVGEEDMFFAVLKRCLERHMRAGSVFRGCFQDTTSKFEDERIFNEIITDPHLDYQEVVEGNLLWVTIRKLRTAS